MEGQAKEVEVAKALSFSQAVKAATVLFWRIMKANSVRNPDELHQIQRALSRTIYTTEALWIASQGHKGLALEMRLAVAEAASVRGACWKYDKLLAEIDYLLRADADAENIVPGKPPRPAAVEEAEEFGMQLVWIAGRFLALANGM